MRRIVVGVDGSEGSQRALDWACTEAGFRHASVDVVTAWEPPFVAEFGAVPPAATGTLPSVHEDAARALLDRMVAASHPTDVGGTIDRIAARGAPARVLLDAAEGADMVVVGSRGRGGFAGLLLGSVSSQVVAHAACPVVVVPPER
jgi:nucleotide-binding universal stress UspA family protein